MSWIEKQQQPLAERFFRELLAVQELYLRRNEHELESALKLARAAALADLYQDFQFQRHTVLRYMRLRLLKSTIAVGFKPEDSIGFEDRLASDLDLFKKVLEAISKSKIASLSAEEKRYVLKRAHEIADGC